MFSLREFVLKGLKDAVGKMADYQVILNATGWYEKSVLTSDDLDDLNTLIDKSHVVEIESPITDVEIESPITDSESKSEEE